MPVQIHPQAIVDPKAQLGEDVEIGPFCFIGPHAQIGDGTRAHSPSAEQSGEVDIFGKISGGTKQTEYQGVSIKKFEYVGNYAIRLLFSDGHGSGIYSWELLKSLES